MVGKVQKVDSNNKQFVKTFNSHKNAKQMNKTAECCQFIKRFEDQDGLHSDYRTSAENLRWSDGKRF